MVLFLILRCMIKDIGILGWCVLILNNIDRVSALIAELRRFDYASRLVAE